MSRKMSRRKSPSLPPHGPKRPLVAPSLPLKEWTFLIYMCGDNNLEPYINDDLAELCRTGSLPDVHVVVQCDRREGAQRCVLPEASLNVAVPHKLRQVTDPKLTQRTPFPVNTGDPSEAVKFLLWGIQQAPSRQVAVIFSGLGIGPQYVRDCLSLDGSSPKDSDRRSKIHQQLFSICHDETSQDALEVRELREILEKVKLELGRPIDLIGLDLGAAAFVEIAYQLRGMADVLVASQRLLPDDGWPYHKILTSWQDRLAQRQSETQALAALIVNATVDVYRRQDVRMVAVNLAAMEDVSRVLDTLSVALIHNLGDWHVWNSVRQVAARIEWISPQVPGIKPRRRNTQPIKRQADFLPAVDLLELLEMLQKALASEIKQAPVEYGQRNRIQQLEGLVGKALGALEHHESSRLPLLWHARPKPDRGLSILFPPARTPKEIDSETGPIFSLSDSNYLQLDFSRSVH
jgi:hypothetical protein